MLKRRDVITLLGGLAAAPLVRAPVARAQRMPIVGYLAPLPVAPAFASAFRQGLAEAGFAEGRNMTFESRLADGDYERLPGLAAELVGRRVDVIAVITPVAALAAKSATTTIPIVFELGSDPVKDGLVPSLARPGGNVTGVTFFNNLLTAKRMEMLHDIMPNLAVVGHLVNPNNANVQLELTDAQAAARALGLRLVVVRAISVPEIEAAFAELVQQQVRTLLVAGDAFLNAPAGQIVSLALRHGIATSFAGRPPVEAGGLVSYSASRVDSSHQFGLYLGRVLKGEKPADLPVMQPTRFEMIINLKTARALGLTISRELLFRADEVIE